MTGAEDYNTVVINLVDDISIPSFLAQYQGKLLRGVIDFYTNNGAANAYTSSYKNIVVNGSRGLAYAYNNLAPSAPF
jgi:hypothetical protein